MENVIKQTGFLVLIGLALVVGFVWTYAQWNECRQVFSVFYCLQHIS